MGEKRLLYINWLPDFGQIIIPKEINLAVEQRKLLAKHDAGIMTENDKQLAEINARKAKARKEGEYFQKIANIYSRPTLILGLLDPVLEFAAYSTPGMSTIKIIDDGSKAILGLKTDIKYGQVIPAIGHGLLTLSAPVLALSSLIPFTGFGVKVATNAEKGLTNTTNSLKKQYTAYRASDIINEYARHPIDIAHHNVPMEPDILYHTTEGRRVYKNGMFLRNNTLNPRQKVIAGIEHTPGELKLDGNIYRSARQRRDKDYIWWDTNELPDKNQTLIAPSDYVRLHNYGKEVYIRRKAGSKNLMNSMGELLIDPFGGSYRDSYYITTPENTTTDNTVKLVWDSFSNSYIPHVKGKIVNNRMSPTELLDALESDKLLVQKHSPKIYLELTLRPSKLTYAEKLGIPKHERFDIKDFQSNLNWNARDYFYQSGRTSGGLNPIGHYEKMWSMLDEGAFQFYIPEYLKIEKATRNTNNWLKLSDGSLYLGDSRSWILTRSKSFKNAGLLDLPVLSGHAFGRSPSAALYDVWGVPQRYADKAFEYGNGQTGTYISSYVYPENSKILEINLPNTHSTGHGTYFSLIPKEIIPKELNLYPYKSTLTTDNIVEASKRLGNDITKINNVVEGVGGNTPVTDIVIHRRTPRKILEGNNGNFDMLNKNPYKKSGGKINYLTFYK